MTATRSHVAPFLEGLSPYAVLLRNAIPAAGVFWLGWSVPLAIFLIWFDGMGALGALLAAHVHGSRHEQTAVEDFPDWAGWLLALLLLGAPYWFALYIFVAALLPADFWRGELLQPWSLVALLVVLAGHVFEESGRRYGRMGRAKRLREFNWHFHLHLARVAVILGAAFFFRSKYFLLAAALALSYLEIYPMRTLRFLGGDATLDADNQDRSSD